VKAEQQIQVDRDAESNIVSIAKLVVFSADRVPADSLS
jgi:hypothetical protein